MLIAGTVNEGAVIHGLSSLASGDFCDVGCCLCGSQDRRLWFETPTIDGIEVVECGRCGLVYVTPQVDPRALERVYQEAYWQSPSAKDYGYTDYVADQSQYLRTFRRRLHKHVLPHKRDGVLLDVGCAAGYFVLEAARAGFDAHGIDVAVPMVDYARQCLGLESVRQGTIEDDSFEDESFDVVTLWDVVEHLADPMSVLRHVRRVLKPDGLLVIETQNVRSAFARLMGKRWHHFKMIEHLHHFDPSTCTRMLETAGFHNLRWTSRNAGKYVPMRFIVERSARLARWLPRALSPLMALSSASMYVNLFDEMVFVAKR